MLRHLGRHTVGELGLHVITSALAHQLVLNDVTKRFGGVEAVSHLSLTVSSGEVLGVIGPNGAGKSTLLSLISGAQRPSAGEITFRGRRVDRLSAHAVARLGIGRAHQIPRPFGRMTVLDNVQVATHSTAPRARAPSEAVGVQCLTGAASLPLLIVGHAV
jgi:ABC-type branched-subunit amino acid transport system ATPase component